MIVNERFIWATKILNPQPGDRVLEIGCGAGILVQLVAAQLSSGQVIAIDKSAAMIKSAAKRNEVDIKHKKVQLLLEDFSATTFAKEAFDKILAFNVNNFMRKPIGELSLVRRYLKPSGSLYLFYQPPHELNTKFIEEAKNALLKNNFEIMDVVRQKLKSYSALCIISRPA